METGKKLILSAQGQRSNFILDPVQDILYVDMPLSSTYQISIIDIQGRTVLTTKDAAQGIDIRELPAALYALIITDMHNTTIGSAHFFKK